MGVAQNKLRRLSALLVCIVLIVLPSCTDALIHKLEIEDDSRKHFFIENFGFNDRGELHMTITDWKIDGQPFNQDNEKYGKKLAFLIKVTDTDSTAFLEESPDECYLDVTPSENARHHIVWAQQSNLTAYTKIIDADNEGFYNTYFINCLGVPVSFTLRLEQYNVETSGKRNYLSAGQTQLPTIYGLFTAVYFALTVVWVVGFLRGPGKTVNRVHYLMTVLLGLKVLSLLFQALEMHFTKTTGSPGGWQVAYFIFAGLRTGFFFVLVALIGTGWAFVKPFLSEKDKRIIAVVIPLQILDNVAMMIVDATAPGSQTWFTWKDIFRLVDIICCGAVLIPIIWSIKHLREASQIDGKVARNLQKLKLFRQFYLIVVSYIYFTRIIIFLLDATLPFKWVWLGDLFSELAALCFFCVVGYKFRPSDDNPYFKLDAEEDAVRLEEMASKERGDDD